MQLHPEFIRKINKSNTPNIKKAKWTTSITKEICYTAIIRIASDYIDMPYGAFLYPTFTTEQAPFKHYNNLTPVITVIIKFINLKRPRNQMIATAIAMMVLMKTYTIPLKVDPTYNTTKSSEHLAQYLSSWKKNKRKAYRTKSIENTSVMNQV